MKKILLFLLFSFYLFSKGTVAGLDITNQATITLNLNGVESKINSNIDSFIVDKIIDIKLNSADNEKIEVGANEKDRVLTFVISNLGNAPHQFDISYENNNSSNFFAKNIRIFQDINSNNIFDSKDIQISSISLENDKNATLFLVANIPENNKTIPNNISINTLIAKTDINSTKTKDRANEVDIVVRNNIAKDEGIFIIRDYWLSSIKSALIRDEDKKLHTGSIIDYKIKVFIGGKNSNRQIDKIKLTDPIPTGTTYISNSLTFNSNPLTDEDDGDIGSFKNGAIEVNIGTIRNDQVAYIKFSVLVN